MKMKKIIATTILGALAFLIMLGNVQAQKKYINKASLWAKDGVKLDTALNAVVFCETQEKTKDWFKTYYAKGLVFEAIAKTENEEFKNLSELESLCDSLESMLVYYEQCKKDGEDLPELVYRINNHK